MTLQDYVIKYTCDFMEGSSSSEVPDTTGRKVRGTRRRQAISKYYAFHANTTKQLKRTYNEKIHVVINSKSLPYIIFLLVSVKFPTGNHSS